MGKPIGYNPARLQRAYLPMSGIELCEKNFTEFLSDLKKWSAFFLSSHKITARMIFSARLKGGQKMAAGFFISTRHSEQHFELKNSEFSCEMKF